MENECEALPGVAYPGVRDNRSTLNTKTGYDDDDDDGDGPSVWNSLPEHLRAPDLTLNSFRHSMKTFLFTQMTHAAH